MPDHDLLLYSCGMSCVVSLSSHEWCSPEISSWHRVETAVVFIMSSEQPLFHVSSQVIGLHFVSCLETYDCATYVGVVETVVEARHLTAPRVI